jgi:hypothetical protein
MINFKKYLNIVENLPENFDWVKDFTLPDLNLDLPCVEKRGKIQIIMDKTNPIYIGLSDGSKLFFTIDEFKRISGKPVIGKILTWKTQRLFGDKSEYQSKIISCKIED